MTLPDISETPAPYDCPRCGLHVAPDPGQTWAEYQVANCLYCAENLRRMAAGRPILPEPTALHPTWSE